MGDFINFLFKCDRRIDSDNDRVSTTVLSREFEAVEIEIRDDTGRPVPFERGKVTMTLHLRRHRRTGLF